MPPLRESWARCEPGRNPARTEAAADGRGRNLAAQVEVARANCEDLADACPGRCLGHQDGEQRLRVTWSSDAAAAPRHDGQLEAGPLVGGERPRFPLRTPRRWLYGEDGICPEEVVAHRQVEDVSEHYSQGSVIVAGPDSKACTR